MLDENTPLKHKGSRLIRFLPLPSLEHLVQFSRMNSLPWSMIWLAILGSHALVSCQQIQDVVSALRFFRRAIGDQSFYSGKRHGIAAVSSSISLSLDPRNLLGLLVVLQVMLRLRSSRAFRASLSMALVQLSVRYLSLQLGMGCRD